MKNSPSSKTGLLLAKLILACLIVAPATVKAQTYWQGGSNDFNNAAYWTGAYIDTSGDSSPNPNCDNDTGTNNVILIQAGDPPWYHGDTLAGNNNGNSGAYLQTGGTNNTGYPNNGNWLRMGIASGSAGYYTLSNGVVNVAGQTHLGENGYGYLEIDGGVYNTGYNGDPGICAGDGDFGPGSGTFVLNAGTVNNFQESWFGEQNSSGSGTGAFIMNGGTFNAQNWFVLGRNGGTGTGTMTGGILNFTGGGNFLVGGGGNGTLTQSGGTINAYNAYLVPQNGGGSGYDTLSGSAALTVYSWLAVGRGGYGEMDISGNASVTHSDSGSHFDIGAGGSSATGAGVLNQNGGTVTELTSDFWLGEVYTATWNLNSGTANILNLVMSVNNGVQSTMNLSGGVLNVNSISSPTGQASYSVLNLNGGTLRANGSSSVFINGLVQASVGGSVTIDSQGYNITIPQSLADNGGGSLIKVGTGTLALTGANGYSGGTTVSAGTLATTTASTGGGAYSVAGGTTLSVEVASAGTYLPASSLAFSGPATLDINLNTFGVPSAAPINVSGTLTANGTVTINLASSSPLAVGTIPLVQYGSPAGSGTFVLGSVPAGETGYLSNSGGLISLVITSAGAPRWNGNVTGGVWDINTTTNWIDLISGDPTTYHDGEPVLFDDTATGTTTVNVSMTVKPGSLTFNNTQLPYTLTGSGSISGTTGVLLEGSNTVSMLNTGGNSYTGPTVINAGTLAVASLANGGSPSAIGASSASPTNLVLAGGTLSYTGAAAAINRGYEDADTNGAVDIATEGNLSLSGTITVLPGTGFTKAGPGQLAYANSGISTLSDALGYSVDQGTVLFSGTGTNNIAGTFLIGAAGSTNAAVALTNNTTLNVLGGTVEVGNAGGSASRGAITQAGGTFNAGNGQIWIGQGTGGIGALILTGGTFYADNWLAVGRDNGTGTLNVSGNAVLIDNGGGGNMDIGTSGGFGGVAGTGTLNQTGGAITNTASEVWLGEGASGEPASGTWNMSGGTANVGEVHVGVGGTGTSTLNVSGSASITESYLLLANYDTNTVGNVNIGSASQPGGAITVNADMDVGGQGTGTLNFVTNGGGTLTVTGTLYLSRFSQVANGTVNLNAGGTLIAGYINNGWGFQNNFSSPLDNPNAFNFNGGTLRAYVGSQYFIQPYVNAVVQSGGAIIDDGGYDITVLAPLVNGGGGGGLTKLGVGTLILNGVNTYTGMTIVSSGTLAIASTGSIAGPVTVASGATLAADTGSIQTAYIYNTLTLNAGSTTSMKLTPSSNDQIAGLTGVTYGGALVVNNTSGSALTAGNVFKLFNSAAPGTGNFSSVTILPAGAGTFNAAAGTLTITSTGAPPVVNAPALVNGKLVLTGSGGTAGSAYTLLSSTNVTTPRADWITNTSGVFSPTGTFSNAIPITNIPAMFFQLKTP